MVRHYKAQTTIVFLAAVLLTVQPVFLQTTDVLGNVAFLPAPQQTLSKTPAILRLQSNVNEDGTFTYTFDTENGISAHAESTITKTADPDQSIQTVRGQYSYTGPDGVQYTIQYIADHNGYQAFGEHLPTPPPIPEAILRSLEHNAAHPEEDGGIVAATPALAPSSNAILANLSPRPTTPHQPIVAAPLQPIIAAPLTHYEPLANPTAVPTRSPAHPTLPKQQQQSAQVQLLAHTQVLQQQQLQPQALQLAQLQPQQFQPQQLQLQPQQLQLTQVQPQQLQLAQLQPRQLQPQLQPQQLQPQQFESQQLHPQQLHPQQLQPQQLQPQQLQPQQLHPQQLQSQQLAGRQLQPQDFLTQFAPSFQNFETQRRLSANV